LTKKWFSLVVPARSVRLFFQSLAAQFVDNHPCYLNWGSLDDRKKVISGFFDRNQKLLIFDEIHKFSKWRSLIKGYYDKLKNTRQFLRAGSFGASMGKLCCESLIEVLPLL
jgi:predicted AAA+ superfamily ATPase